MTLGLLRAAVVLEFALLLGPGFGRLPDAPRPAAVAPKPERLPQGSGLTLERGKATLVVVLDPNAASAEVSLAELRRTVAGRDETLTAHVVFVVRDDEFVPRPLWTNAASIPGAHVLRDSGGVEAARLAAMPGTTVLYAADRRLLYRGGSTLDIPPFLDLPTTDSVPPPPPRKDSAQRRPGALDDWIDDPSSLGSTPL